MKNLKARLRHWWRLEWAKTKAYWYALAHPGTHMHVESRWTEVGKRPRPLSPPFDYVIEEDGPEWVESITFVGVARGSMVYGDLQIVRSYYGDPRFPSQAYYGGQPMQ